MNDFITNLNPEQRAAVLAVNGPVKIVAGAGSGKTRVITSKIAYLIKYLSIEPWNICAVTFTNKACQEMKQRVIDLIGQNGQKCQIFTYHALCARILREEIHFFNYPTSFAIIDSNDQDQILRKIYRQQNLTVTPQTLKMAKSTISNWKNSFFLPSEVLIEAVTSEEKQLAKIYDFYQQQLLIYNSLDFDDLLLFVHQLFLNAPEILKKWQAKFSYLLVDEFQDTNEIQFDIINKLVMSHHNITVVGDPDQTIYSWRGAKMNIILNFENIFPECQTIILNQNYRSTVNILQLANGLISNNKLRIKKDLITFNEQGNKISLYQGSSPNEEANFIAVKIKELLLSNEFELQDILILYRANYLSRELELVLSDYGLSYQIVGAFKFYERKEIKDCIAFLRALIGTDLLSIERVLLTVDKLGPKSVSQILEILKINHITLFELLTSCQDLLPVSFKIKLQKLSGSFIEAKKILNSKNEVAPVLSTLINLSGYLTTLENNYEEERKENILELLTSIKKYDQDIILSDDQNKNEILQNYLELVSLQTNSNLQEESNKISLMTIHNAKGLEKKIVFIVGLNEGIFPTSQSIKSGNSALEEERRTFYVAITRAQKLLFISYAGGYSFITNNQRYQSRFINELDLSFCQFLNKEDKILSINNKNSIVSNNKTLFFNNKINNNFQLINWKIGDKLSHEIFGAGEVVKIIASNIQVKFESGLTKIIAINSQAIVKKIIKN